VIAYKSNDTPELTGGSSGSMVVDDDDKVIAINFAGSTKKDDEYTSMQSVGLFLNTKNSYFGSSYQYEVLTD
jgi:V8-like Glu-specific endopeptidase